MREGSGQAAEGARGGVGAGAVPRPAIGPMGTGEHASEQGPERADADGRQRGLEFAGVTERGTFRLDVTFEVPPGRVLGVLGPNGSGKTTLLRALAGLTPLSTGEIRLDGRVLDSPGREDEAGVFVPPNERRVGMLFQDYRLFPHLRVRDNVLFGPRSRGVPKERALGVAEHWLERLDLAELASRRPSQLSGGQAQRVALARALATEPELLVFDEPLAALDSRTRLDVRAQLRRHLADFTGPVVMVTHDPVEAMVMTDELLVVEAGAVVQRGTPAEVAARPLTDYVARLVGLNLYAGDFDGVGAVTLDDGGMLLVPASAGAEVPATRVFVAVRPESISVFPDRPGPGSPRNVWPGTIDGIDVVGQRVRLHVAGQPGALVDVTAAALAELGLAQGSRVWLSAKASELVVYPDER